VVRRTWDWLAEQPEDAAELALLLFEAAPKLNFSETGPSRQASCKIPRRASYKEQGGFKRRLARAVPMLSGEGRFLVFGPSKLAERANTIQYLHQSGANPSCKASCRTSY